MERTAVIRASPHATPTGTAAEACGKGDDRRVRPARANGGLQTHYGWDRKASNHYRIQPMGGDRHSKSRPRSPAHSTASHMHTAKRIRGMLAPVPPSPVIASAPAAPLVRGRGGRQGGPAAAALGAAWRSLQVTLPVTVTASGRGAGRRRAISLPTALCSEGRWPDEQTISRCPPPLPKALHKLGSLSFSETSLMTQNGNVSAEQQHLSRKKARRPYLRLF